MVIFFTALPIVFSGLLCAAHFYRNGSIVLTVVSVMLPCLLFSKNRHVPKVLTVFLLLAAGEWIRTMLVFIEQYQAGGVSWTRLAVILSTVALFTASSALVFKTSRMIERYSSREYKQGLQLY